MSDYGNGDYYPESERDQKIENSFEPKDERCNIEEILNNFDPRAEDNLKDEVLQLKSRRKLLYDNPIKIERECGNCYQIKPYDEFKNRSDSMKKKRSICKKCEAKIEGNRLQLKNWINKIKAIKFVTKGKNTCQICYKIGIENLPMLDFHHPYPELSSDDAKKKGFWRSIRYNS